MSEETEKCGAEEKCAEEKCAEEKKPQDSRGFWDSLLSFIKAVLPYAAAFGAGIVATSLYKGWAGEEEETVTGDPTVM
jgi:hypothetical protein